MSASAKLTDLRSVHGNVQLEVADDRGAGQAVGKINRWDRRVGNIARKSWVSCWLELVENAASQYLSADPGIQSI